MNICGVDKCMNECFIGGISGAGLAAEAAPAPDSGATSASPKCPSCILVDLPFLHPCSMHSCCVPECVWINATPLCFGRNRRCSQDFRVYFLLLTFLQMIWMAVPQAGQ